MTSGADDDTRAPHAVLDEQSRIKKAKKIAIIVGSRRMTDARRILEIGCGSGVIAKTLATLGGPELEVDAVDIVDNRIVKEGYRFQLVSDPLLPFSDGLFDAVVSNHVIEHVGCDQQQALHLAEIRRVLAPQGVLYLAVPNKWRIHEPHFRLPFLSWFPSFFADRYVRLSGRGQRYDCIPLSRNELLGFLAQAGLAAQDRTTEAMHVTFALESPSNWFATRVLPRIPTFVLSSLLLFVPTFVVTATKSDTAAVQGNDAPD